MKTTITTFLLIVFVSAYCQVPTNGLFAYYPFSGNALDMSNNGYHGTVNGATLTLDRFGNPNSAYRFNGTSNYINLSNYASDFNSLQKASISFWVQTKFDTPQAVFSLDDGASSYESNIYVGNNCTGELTNELITCSYVASPSNYYITGFTTTNRNLLINSGWHHIVCIYDNISTKFYLDNNLVTSSGTFGTNNGHIGNLNIAQKVLIGTRYHNGYAAFLNGELDDIRIYNRALSPAEITELFIENVTSTETIINNNIFFEIYPNPTHDYVFINAKNLPNKSKYSITILNSIGQSVYQSSINQHKTQINIHELGESGIYFFKIVNENGDLISIQKIVLQ